MCRVLLSYPRSGNHLVRFFIELLTNIPTFGCKSNKHDIEIYKNNFEQEVEFTISKYKNEDCYHKYHFPPNNEDLVERLICIVRNPKEVLLRQHNFKLVYHGWDGFQTYFKNIDYYNNFKGKKLLLFYEDILIDKVTFIDTLYSFLDVNDEAKKSYVLDNLEKLFIASATAKYGDWGGIQSNFQLNYYYDKIPPLIKQEFDTYITDASQKYHFLKDKYNL
jgi:hypothetical protein